jgi:hypothetical protein
MPTIPQLPVANTVTAQDELPLSQNGITYSVTIGELLSGTQPVIELPTGTVLGRASLGPGGPEALTLGPGVVIESPNLQANGGDHKYFAEQPTLTLTDQAILNSGGTPMRMSLPLLRGLFSAGSNIGISLAGTVAAYTDPGVTSELSSLSSGLTTTEANLAALEAKIPPGGFVGLNAEGEITDPMAGSVTLGTVEVETSAPSRTLQARALDTLNIVDFGAVIGGGDCTAAFNAAFAALPNNGGEIFMPAGDYEIATPLVLSGPAVTLRGAGKGITRLHLTHTGVGFDITPANPFNKTILRDFSAYAANTTGQTAAVAVLNYPAESSFGYVSALISDIECFGYPNAANGISPFPQTFLRGFVLNNCWSAQINNVSCFGPPAAAGATNSAVIELNGSFDTRIIGLQCYYNHAAILQTGYCEGIYATNPLVVGADYFFAQTDETTWPGYQPDKPMLLGLWAANGELNTNLGTAQLANVTDGFFVGLDITRDGGPATAQTLFDWTNVSNFIVVGCNFVGGSGGTGNNQDIAFRFSSTWNSSGNTIGSCHFENLATVMDIVNVNGTVGLSTFALNISNVPLTTAFIDNSGESVGNYLTFLTPATSSVPTGMANTKDHVLAGAAGEVLFRINNVVNAANFIRHQPATSTNPPTICFDGTDGSVNGVIQTKGGNLYVNGAGGSNGHGNLISLLNVAEATNWVQVQNATSANLCEINTNQGGLGVQPQGALWLSPGSGLFAPNLPTTKPTSGSHQIWNNNGVVSIA